MRFRAVTKLKRDARAWVHRVKMGKARLWAVVEGKDFDTPYYERLLSPITGEGTRIMLAEDLEVDGTSAGGKTHVLKIFKLFESESALRQENKATAVDVMFFLDQDDDSFTQKMVTNDHVVYTEHADIEAEIVARSNPAEAVSIAFGLPREVAAGIDMGSLLRDLAEMWDRWIILRLASAKAEWSDTRFAQKSRINVPMHGAVDDSRVDAICARVVAACPDWETLYSEAEKYFANAKSVGQHGHLVKGKWAPWLLIKRVRDSVPTGRGLPTVGEAYMLGALLMSIDFSAQWAEPVREKIRLVLAA